MDTRDKLRRLAAGAGDLIVAALNLTNEQDVAYVKGVSRTAFFEQLENAYNLDRPFPSRRLPWIRSTEMVPFKGKYLVCHTESKEFVICDFDGRTFSYSYWKDDEEMLCEFSLSDNLYWCQMEFPE